MKDKKNEINEIKFDDFLMNNLKKSTQEKVSDNFTLKLMNEVNSLNLYKKVNYNLQTEDENIKKYVKMFVGVLTATLVILILFAVKSGTQASQNQKNNITYIQSNEISIKQVTTITNNLTGIIVAKSLSLVSKTNVYSNYTQFGFVSIISLSLLALLFFLVIDRFVVKKLNL